jgi:hypothetical protein
MKIAKGGIVVIFHGHLPLKKAVVHKAVSNPPQG